MFSSYDESALMEMDGEGDLRTSLLRLKSLENLKIEADITPEEATNN